MRCCTCSCGATGMVWQSGGGVVDPLDDVDGGAEGDGVDVGVQRGLGIAEYLEQGVRSWGSGDACGLAGDVDFRVCKGSGGIQVRLWD